MINRVWIFHRSRDTRFVLRIAIAMAAVSIAVGWVISAVTFESGLMPFFAAKRLPHAPQMMEYSQASEGLSIDDLARWIREPVGISEAFTNFGGHWGIPRGAGVEGGSGASSAMEIPDDLFEAVGMNESERDLLQWLNDGLHGGEDVASTAREELFSAAAEAPPREYASEFLGDVLTREREYVAALEQFREEVRRFGDRPHSRKRVIRLLKQEGHREELREVFRDPEYAAVLQPGERLEIATWLRDWPALVQSAIAFDLDVKNSALLVLSLLAGGVWFVIVTQFAGYGPRRCLLFAAALLLGGASATATLVLVQIQEGIQGFTLSYQDNIARQILFYVAGVGLREETLKLVFFLPLLPALLRRRDEAEVLVCAGLVGLGFAINENIVYVASRGEFTVWTRFLTANFLHIAMTGVIGLSFYRMCRWPKQYWDNFLVDFLIVVAVHGAYNSLQDLPALSDYSPAVLIVFALIAYLFLDHASHLKGGRASHRVSPLAVFVWGSALLLGVIFGYACWGMPFRVALGEYILSLASMVPIAFVFINRLRDH